MWEDIERISGLPFSDLRSPSGVDAELCDRSATSLSLLNDFHFAGQRSTQDVNEVETGQLQQELLHATNHAIAIEIEAGNERERNRALKEENASLQKTCEQLNAGLRDRASQLQVKDDELSRSAKAIEALRDSLKSTEEDLLLRVEELENELSKQKVSEEHLRSQYSKACQDLNESNSKNNVYEERVMTLKGNLENEISQSKQRENNAVEMVRSEAKHNTAMLKATLHSTEQQLAAAESRERQASVLAAEARKDRNELLNKMNDNIENVRKDISSIHATEMEKMSAEIESAKKKSSHLSEQLQSLTKQMEKSANNLTDAKEQVKFVNRIAKGKDTECKRLQSELDQAKKFIETLVADVATHKTRAEHLEKSKNDCEQSLQTLKTTLEDERHKHTGIINSLESNLLAFIQERFSSQQIK